MLFRFRYQLYAVALLLVLFWLFVYIDNVQPWLHAMDSLAPHKMLGHYGIAYSHSHAFPGSRFLSFLSHYSPADTDVYLIAARAFPLENVPLNQLGPVLIYKLFLCSFPAVFLFNLASLLYPLLVCRRQLKFYFPVVIIVMLLNPALIMCLFTANKEVYGAIAFVYLYVACQNSKFRFVILALVYAFLSKYQLFGYMVYAFVLISLPKKYYRYMLLLGLTVALSCFQKFRFVTFNSMLDTASNASIAKNFSLNALINQLNVEYFALPVTFLPKILLYLADGGWYWGGLCGAVICFFVKLSDKSSPFFLIFIGYMLVIATVPFVQYRYISIVFCALVISIFVSLSNKAPVSPQHS